jgi:hypothetical protein
MPPDPHITVAALYIDPRGPYPSIQGVDPWDEPRDATRYAGPWPVVAHPPCAAWSCMWGCRRSRSRPGQGDTTAAAAVAQVRRWGGILEQPVGSALMHAHYVPTCGAIDLWGGHVVQLNQSEWGHVATKPTWIYLCRCPDLPAPPYPGRLGRHVADLSKLQRRRTPPMLAAALVAIAAQADPTRLDPSSTVRPCSEGRSARAVAALVPASLDGRSSCHSNNCA